MMKSIHKISSSSSRKSTPYRKSQQASTTQMLKKKNNKKELTKRNDDYTTEVVMSNKELTSSNIKEKNTIIKSWNDMSHLSVKRFHDNDPILTSGAIRNRTKEYPYIACAELDPSGRSTCKRCGTIIPKHNIRLSLMMECHKGYRNPCTLHYKCFFQHPETLKLINVNEIYMKKGIKDEKIQQINESFRQMKQQQQQQHTLKIESK